MLLDLGVSLVVSATLVLASNAQAFARSIVASSPRRGPLPSSTVAPATVAPWARGWVTTPDGLNLARPLPSSAISLTYPSAPPAGAVAVAVDATSRYQSMDGFGASLTDSAAVLINHLPAAARQAALTDLFNPGSAASVSLLRLPMGASDLALSAYTYDDMPAGQSDTKLSHFNVTHDDANIVPVLKGALGLNPNIKVLATPWSAPAWMKTGGSLFGGSLSGNQYQTFANYFVKFIQSYAARGIPIYAVTPQNEPENANSTYPTMTMTATQEATFVGKYLGPALARAGYGNVKILGYDHNWGDTTYPTQLLGNTAAIGYLAGTAFHCYSGNPTAQTVVHDQYPNKGVWFTECSGTLGSSFAGDLGWNSDNLLIGAPRNWAKTVMFWSLALDPTGGPHTGGCGSCRGVITVDPSTGTFTPNVEHALLAQATDAADPGAVRIASPGDAVANVAFVNPDGSRSMIVHNAWTTARMVIVQDGSLNVTTTVPAGSTVTLRWAA